MQESKTITCKTYDGKLPLILALSEMIESDFNAIFTAIIVHGSIATNEIIPYSDFDGLLIIKDEYKDSKEIKLFIKKSMRLINNFDPLQHHGWFIIYESELKNYPQTYFPIELFKFSTQIFPENKIVINIDFPNNIDYYNPFNRFSASMQKKINSKWRPTNMYQLKSFLSEIMLLPAIFYQAKYKKGIYKKNSFELVKPDISTDAWKAIEISTKIREKWYYNFTYPEWLFIMLKDNRFTKKIARLFLSPKIPSEFSDLLDENFYSNCHYLLVEMDEKLAESKNIIQ